MDHNASSLRPAVLSDCTLCPRNCHVDRLRGERGFCGETGVLRAARAALYYNEEPVISGQRGSGTVFFTGCCLGCIYCQNRQISRPAENAAAISRGPSPEAFSAVGAPPLRTAAPYPAALELSPGRLCEIFLELEEAGAHNINLVTPEHFVPLILPALEQAKKQGLSIPVVYNTGSYERVESVKALEGLVDVWMPDLKYFSPALSRSHLGVSDYFRCASAAIAEMVRQCPDPVFSDGSSEIDCPDDADDPLMLRGVLVRHLALPGCAEDSRAVLRYLHETYGDHIFISIMNQYTPMPQVLKKQECLPPPPSTRASSAGSPKRSMTRWWSMPSAWGSPTASSRKEAPSPPPISRSLTEPGSGGKAGRCSRPSVYRNVRTKPARGFYAPDSRIQKTSPVPQGHGDVFCFFCADRRPGKIPGSPPAIPIRRRSSFAFSYFALPYFPFSYLITKLPILVLFLGMGTVQKTPLRFLLVTIRT